MAKRRTIDSLREGDRIDGPFLVKNIRQAETRAGKPYLVIAVQDATGELSGPIWDNVDSAKAICGVGEIVHFSGSVQSYRENLQLRVDAFAEVDKATVDLGQFLPSTTRDRVAMEVELQTIVESIRNSHLKKMLRLFFFKGDIWQSFQVAPAAKGMHHAYIAGLLEHTLSVAKAADLLAGHYPGVDRSRLLAGALLHDIGKIRELRIHNGVVEYTDIGRLKGHLVIGLEMVTEAAGKIEDFPEELLHHIQHMLLSHHGRLEFGSPTVPMTVEAFILSMVDDLDAKMNVMEQLRRKMTGEKPTWTEYQKILERYLYLGPLTERPGETAEKNETQDGRRQPSLF